MNHAGSLFVPDHRRLQSRCEQAPQEAQLPPQACLPALWSRIMPRITRKQARAMTAIRTRLIQLCANQSAISGDLLSRSRRSGTDAAFFDRLCRFLHFIQEVRKSQASRFPAVWAGSLRSQPVCRSIGDGSFSANGQLIGFLVGPEEHVDDARQKRKGCDQADHLRTADKEQADLIGNQGNRVSKRSQRPSTYRCSSRA